MARQLPAGRRRAFELLSGRASAGDAAQSQDAPARPSQSEFTGLLQGWALFDNTLDEDLENVEMTFVAGMPVSFVYDLYTPFTPDRPVVEEEGRGVAAPVEFEAARWRVWRCGHARRALRGWPRDDDG